MLNDAFTIERGFMTSLHAYTPTQPVLDSPRRDLRRARAAAINLIPTSTGATRALGTVLVDLVVELGRAVGVAEVNEAVRHAAAEQRMAGILQYSEEPLVSTDIVHSSCSCIFDGELTTASDALVKVFGRYDNEWGYSCRLVDLVDRLV